VDLDGGGASAGRTIVMALGRTRHNELKLDLI
jgi:hypothetical protein